MRFFCGTACCISSILRAQQDASQMNVLFIMADDMRPRTGVLRGRCSENS